MRGIPGTSLTQSLASGRQITEALRRIPAVRSVAQQTGRAELGEDTWGVEYSELEVDLHPLDAEDAEQVERRLKATLRDVPGFSFEVLTYLSERIEETLSGTNAPVVVQLAGDDLQALDRAARAVADVLNTVPGHGTVRTEAQAGLPELVIRPRPEDIARLGLRTGQVLDALHTAFQGAEVGQVYDRNRIIDLVVILAPEARRDPEAVAGLWLSLPPGAGGESSVATGTINSAGRIPLRQVADIFLSDGRWLITHEGGLRRQVVTAQVQRRDVESFVTDAERRLQQVALPPGVSFTVTGEHLAKQAAQRELLLLGGAVGVGIGLLLWTAFGSARLLLLVLANLPFALVGGVAAIYLGGGILDVGALVGFVTLFGISVRNSIMMVSHWQHLQHSEAMPFGPELVFRGARERLVPVLMTALVTALGLLPIALATGEAGREVEGPMACVILGGLVTSTVLNLIVLPVLYRRIGHATRQGEQPFTR
jgi:Cu/Ag efflux pump CusA